MAVSVVVPVFNGGRYLPAFLQSLDQALPGGTQVIFVDDGSTEPVLADFPEFRNAIDVTVIRNERNLGYAASVNRGFALCTGDFVVQLNTDLILEPGCITSMVDFLRSHPDAGIVGSKLLYPTTQRVQHIGMAFGRYTRKRVYSQLPADHPLVCRTRPMQILAGATVAMTRHVLGRIGPLDERYFNYNEDLDHCLKAMGLGLVNYTCANSIAYHWVSQSGASRFARIREAEAVFWSTWHGRHRIDLDTFVDEALEHLVARDSFLTSMEFDALNLCRSGDDLLLLDRARRYWPYAVDRVHQFQQLNNPDAKYWIPMLLPFELQQNPKPFIYFVDEFSQLDENRLWFHSRLKLVRDEIIIDSTGCAITVSELLSMGGGT